MMFPRLLLVALFFCITVSSLFAENNDPALDRFRKDMASLDAFAKKKGEELKGNPLGGLLVFRSMIAGVKAVQTDGLPDDLKTAFNDAVTTLTKAAIIFDGWPDKPDEVVGYLRQRMSQDPKFMENFQDRMGAMSKDIDAVSKKMDEMGKKYGFSNIGGGGEPPK